MTATRDLTTGDASSSPIDKVLVRHPVIVIGIPCYNEERFLQQTIDSLREQTWTDFAVLISDNASTDRTGEIGRAAAAADGRFHYRRHPENIGSAENFNSTRDSTDSEFLMWLGGHDLIAPTFLERHLTALQADSRLSLSTAYSAWIDDNGTIFDLSRGWMDECGSYSLIRYIVTPHKNDECVEINNVIRRSYLKGIKFGHFWGTDIVILAHLNFYGPMHCVPEALYLRRVVSGRAHGYMRRLTGREGVGEDMRAFVDAFLDHLRVLARNDPLLPVATILVRIWLPYRIGMKTSGLAAMTFRLAGRTKQAWRLSRKRSI